MRTAKPALPHKPSRHSSRLQPDTADESAASAEPSDLALAIVNGVCPRCGKVTLPGVDVMRIFVWRNCSC